MAYKSVLTRSDLSLVDKPKATMYRLSNLWYFGHLAGLPLNGLGVERLGWQWIQLPVGFGNSSFIDLLLLLLC